MVRVCVVGGGQAGVSAAFEAATSGARVTLLERSPRLRGEHSSQSEFVKVCAYGKMESVQSLGVELKLEEPVVKVGASCTVRTSRATTAYDAIVLATGSRLSFKPFPGIRKPGVISLDRPDALDPLKDRYPAARSVVVSGSGLSALKVADKLSGEGRRVALLTRGGGADDLLSPEAASLLRSAAAEAGVSFVNSEVDRALGLEAVEAVLAGGRVLPCDLLVIVPEMVPFVPPVEADMHHSGAVIVDSFLQSSYAGIFAAGECAYLSKSGILGGALVGSTTRASGRAAGANASGRKVSFSPVRAFESEIFGLRLSCVGPSQLEVRRKSLDAGITQASSSQGLCSIVFDRRDSRILGAQIVGKPGGQVLDFLTQAVSQGVSLIGMAYQELSDSTDISLVSETAREGLRRRK